MGGSTGTIIQWEKDMISNSLGNAVSITDFLRFKELVLKYKFKRSIVMTNIRFNNLPKLLNNKENKGLGD